MTEQFTAAEVQQEADRQGMHEEGDPEVSEMLQAFATMLEEREKAVPVAWVRLLDSGRARIALGQAEGFVPVYTHPQQDTRDAERYRWLRDISNNIEWPADGDWNDLGEAEGQEFDRIVDDAIAQQNAGREGE